MANEDYRVDTLEDATIAIDTLLTSGRYRVDILSLALEPALYDRPPVADALRSIVTSAGRRAQIRILLEDGAEATRGGHRIVALAQQLTTGIDVRRLSSEDAGYATTCLIVDKRAVIRWQPAGAYAAYVAPDSRAAAHRLGREFLDFWERAEPEPELRRLTL